MIRNGIMSPVRNLKIKTMILWEEVVVETIILLLWMNIVVFMAKTFSRLVGAILPSFLCGRPL
jgi:hypothetical protein